MEEKIRALVRELNPWWEGERIEVPEYRRFVFPEIEKYMRLRQIIGIIGLRRVGKTVLMNQLIEEKLKNTAKENIFYFVFDDVTTQKPEVLEGILNYYLKTIASKGRKYVFLDEIQKVPFWQGVIKRFYDRREDVKFVVSGSSSLDIRKSKESLAGRIFDFYMPPLTFREFLEMNDIRTGRVEFNDFASFYEKNLHKKEVFENMLQEYILRGAFPEIAGEKDEEIVRKYVKSSVVERIVLEDIPLGFGVRKRDILQDVLEYCASETSNLLDLTKLADTLNVNFRTIRAHLFYLQKAFLIDILHVYTKSSAKRLRKNKKVHIAHPSIGIALMNYGREILSANEITGRYMESVVFQHAKYVAERTYFWRSGRYEVDIVTENRKLLPIEVKYRASISWKDAKSLAKFMKRFKLKTGVVVTKNTFDERKTKEGEILFAPAWLFLLMV
ncbi:MAG: ATP-binding protein [Candidatus Aenigmarchaeota archaeon]|nr:ATP-binding protein [Candidatus Aenigmarchaeota archaeon]